MHPGPGGKQLFSKGQVISVATTRWSCLYTLIRRLCNPANELNFPPALPERGLGRGGLAACLPV